MKWQNGYPAVNGAFVNGFDDYEDSSHLAGILALTDHPQAVDMRLYVKLCIDANTGRSWYEYQRHSDAKYDCSRDQAILVMCALLRQGYKSLVNTKFINGKDILLPSVHGIQTIAETGAAKWIQAKTLELEIDFKCRNEASMIGEPFQDFAKCMAYDLVCESNDWLKLWTEKNYLWDVAIYRYLTGGDCSWRGEYELFEHVVKFIKDKIK